MTGWRQQRLEPPPQQQGPATALVPEEYPDTPALRQEALSTQETVYIVYIVCINKFEYSFLRTSAWSLQYHWAPANYLTASLQALGKPPKGHEMRIKTQRPASNAAFNWRNNSTKKKTCMVRPWESWESHRDGITHDNSQLSPGEKFLGMMLRDKTTQSSLR